MQQPAKAKFLLRHSRVRCVAQPPMHASPTGSAHEAPDEAPWKARNAAKPLRGTKGSTCSTPPPRSAFQPRSSPTRLAWRAAVRSARPTAQPKAAPTKAPHRPDRLDARRRPTAASACPPRRPEVHGAREDPDHTRSPRGARHARIPHSEGFPADFPRWHRRLENRILSAYTHHGRASAPRGRPRIDAAIEPHHARIGPTKPIGRQ